MVAFTTFNDRLPDPAFDVNDAGSQVTAGTGNKGPGFANVTVRSKKDTQVSRTNSGRGVSRESGAHVWEIDINYHPMPRSTFDVVQTFLDARNARMNPFYVVLPQYSKPKSAAFQASVNTYAIKTYEAKPAGSSYISIDMNDGALNFSSTTGYPSPGDFFNIDDATDLNHQKAYKVTRVETTVDYNSSLGTLGSSTRVRIHFVPPSTRDVPAEALVKFNNPEFRVVSKGDVFEYNLNTDNLYQFSLNLEELLP